MDGWMSRGLSQDAHLEMFNLRRKSLASSFFFFFHSIFFILFHSFSLIKMPLKVATIEREIMEIKHDLSKCKIPKRQCCDVMYDQDEA
jgi:hypothetical protein